MRQIEVELEWKTDKKNNPFLFGKFKGPFTIDAKDGICFLIWPNKVDPMLAIKGEEDRSNRPYPAKPEYQTQEYAEDSAKAAFEREYYPLEDEKS